MGHLGPLQVIKIHQILAISFFLFLLRVVLSTTVQPTQGKNADYNDCHFTLIFTVLRGATGLLVAAGKR